MTYYSLLIVDKQRTLSTPAGDRSEALEIFGRELGLKLSLHDDDASVAQYLLDEWEVGPHWLNHTIPVLAAPI